MRRRFAELLTLLLMIVAHASISHASSHNHVTEWDRWFGPWPVDSGGSMATYFTEVAAANRSGVLVVIEGTCMSACTIKLAAQHRCVKASAVLWFHAAAVGFSASPTANAALVAAYPPRVRNEVLRRHMLDEPEFNPEHTLTGRELIGLGEKECAQDAGFGERRY
jgi:hypothetical protein